MQESTDRESSKKKNNSAQDAREADSEATSKETLSDIEENEADPGANSAQSDRRPSPDGALDESAEIKDAGPM
jgi:hypothetical protein